MLLGLMANFLACQSQNSNSTAQSASKLDTTYLTKGIVVSSIESGTYEMTKGFELDKTFKFNLRISEYLPNKYYCALNAFDADSIGNIASGAQPFNNNFTIELKNSKTILLSKATSELDSVSFSMGADGLLNLAIFSQISTVNNTKMTFKFIEKGIYPFNDGDDNRLFYYKPTFTTSNVKIPLYKLPDIALPSEIFELDKDDIRVVNDIKSVQTGGENFSLIYFKAISSGRYYYDDYKYHLWIKTADLDKYFKVDKPPRG